MENLPKNVKGEASFGPFHVKFNTDDHPLSDADRLNALEHLVVDLKQRVTALEQKTSTS